MTRHATWLPLLTTALLIAASARAETITVGPSGCDQTTLAAAFLRAAITSESDTAAVSEGGALYVSGGAEAFVRQTYVSDNSGEDGANVALVTGGGSFALFENSVLYDNNPIGVQVIARDGGWARFACVSAWVARPRVAR